MMKWFKRRKEKMPDTASEVREEALPGDESFEPAEADMEETEAETSEPLDAAPASEAAAPPHPEWTIADAELDEEDETNSEAPRREKGRFFKRLRERLHKTREQFAQRVDRVVLGKKIIDLDLLDELEEVLITSDLGVKTTQRLLEHVADKVKRKELSDPQKLREHLQEEIRAILEVPAPPWDLAAHRPFVVMIIGVNGVGKTTTIGKLAHQLKGEGRNVMLAAADTFRAAAVEQLVLWGNRVGVSVIHQKTGSDPSAVVYDALDAASSRSADLLIVDTAGRMHTKVNLMEELKKVHRVMQKKNPEIPHEILLVLDASTGQNALSQARLFSEAMGVTGLILTKLDGTAKGGIVVSICDEMKIPVRYIGIGEGVDDLRPFDAEEFSRALF